MITEGDEEMSRLMTPGEEPEWWDAFTVNPEKAYPKQPLRVKAGQEAVDAADARAMRRAAAVLGERARPTGFCGRFWVKTIAKTLIKVSDAIEEGKL